MLNNLMNALLRLEKNLKILAVISVTWFYIIDIIVEIKLGLQYELENLDVNKVCFAK